MDFQSINHLLLPNCALNDHIFAVKTTGIRYGFQIQLISIHTIKIVVTIVVRANNLLRIFRINSDELRLFFVEQYVD